MRTALFKKCEISTFLLWRNPNRCEF